SSPLSTNVLRRLRWPVTRHGARENLGPKVRDPNMPDCPTPHPQPRLRSGGNPPQWDRMVGSWDEFGKMTRMNVRTTSNFLVSRDARASHSQISVPRIQIDTYAHRHSKI